MTDYLLASLFGVIEGVTEFPPVSSTAHLRLVKALPFIHIPLTNPYWKVFDVVIQLGAVLCLPIYFRKRIVDFIRTFPVNSLTGKRDIPNHPVTLTYNWWTLFAGLANRDKHLEAVTSRPLLLYAVARLRQAGLAFGIAGSARQGGEAAGGEARLVAPHGARGAVKRPETSFCAAWPCLIRLIMA